MSVTRPLDFLELMRSPILIGWEIGDLDPGDHVGDRVLGGEADDRGEHRGRGEDAGGELLSSVNWAIAIAARTIRTTRIASRRRKRSLVLVERETCETAGVMEANLPMRAPRGRVPGTAHSPAPNWGPWLALLGVLLLALGAAIVLLGSRPRPRRPPRDRQGPQRRRHRARPARDQELSFLLVPFAIAASRGAIAGRGGAAPARAARLPAPRRCKWMGAAVGAYLLFAAAYVAIVGEPHQKDIAEDVRRRARCRSC